MWNLLLGVKGLRDNPSVKPAACQLPFQGSLNIKKPPLKGEGDQRSWWRGSLWNLLLNVRGVTEEIPQSACGCQLPFQGSLNK